MDAEEEYKGWNQELLDWYAKHMNPVGLVTNLNLANLCQLRKADRVLELGLGTGE